jgi:hypothetical protein
VGILPHRQKALIELDVFMHNHGIFNNAIFHKKTTLISHVFQHKCFGIRWLYFFGSNAFSRRTFLLKRTKEQLNRYL